MTQENKTNTNVYKRIQLIRHELAKLNIKKSGKNKFTNNVYYELGDFLPELNRLENEHGVMPKFVLQDKRAVLTIFNVDDPNDKEVFYTPVASPDVKGATAIQNLGAQITYLRRYLLMIAYEISEGDTQEAQPQEEVKELDPMDIDAINNAKNLTDLAAVSKKIQAKLKPDMRKALVREYTRRKEELNQDETA